jgi:hypothetical protein
MPGMTIRLKVELPKPEGNDVSGYRADSWISACREKLQTIVNSDKYGKRPKTTRKNAMESGKHRETRFEAQGRIRGRIKG